MSRDTFLHEFLMSVPTPALAAIGVLCGGSLLMQLTGYDFKVTASPSWASADGLPTVEAVNSLRLELEAKLRDADLRLVAFHDASRTLADWDASVRSGTLDGNDIFRDEARRLLEASHEPLSIQSSN